MKKPFVEIILGVVFSAALTCSQAVAGVDVNINIQVPPPLVLPAPPPLMVIPGTYAYFAPDVDVDIIFFEGYWYRPYRGNWYRSTVYNGRWVLVSPRRVPVVLMHLPPNWRRVPPGHERIPYGRVKKNWREWERDKHWDRQERRHEHREEMRGHKHGGGNGRGEGKGKRRGD